jgi:hypothetical protein
VGVVFPAFRIVDPGAPAGASAWTGLGGCGGFRSITDLIVVLMLIQGKLVSGLNPLRLSVIIESMKEWALRLVMVMVMAGFCQEVWAVSQSSNFRIDEDFIGGGGLIESNSANFRSAESIGDTAVGETGSTSFQTHDGYTTTNDPALSVTVPFTSIDFGELSLATAKTATSNFSVKNYTSFGYIVQLSGGSPKTGNDPLEPINPAGASQTGTEQYGINLVANTSPVAQGADPVQQPDATFGFGVAAAGYDTPNMYKFVEGDTIARATRSSGQTDYTISYIVNASTTTAGGTYTGTHQLIVIGTY